VPKRRKYEGKWFQASCSVCVPRSSRAAAINRSVGEFSLSFILAVGSLSNMFTTYSHTLVVSSPAGLRLEISCESDKKKMNLIFNYNKKIFLTEKMKHACRRENEKQGIGKIS
jgi:hypothetical protein